MQSAKLLVLIALALAASPCLLAEARRSCLDEDIYKFYGCWSCCLEGGRDHGMDTDASKFLMSCMCKNVRFERTGRKQYIEVAV